jgi:rubrerythrin
MQHVSEKMRRSESSQTISSIIDKCTLIERYTVKKYKELSKQTDNERAIKLFSTLSMDGRAHALMLNEIKDSLTNSGEISNTIQISAHLGIPEKEDIPYDSGVKQTYYAMKKHLNLEQDFKEIYSELSNEVDDFRAQELFKALAIHETKHHEKLEELIKAFEEMHELLFNEPISKQEISSND